MMSSHTSVALLLCLQWSVLNVAQPIGNLTFSEDGGHEGHGGKVSFANIFPPGEQRADEMERTSGLQEMGSQARHLWKCQSVRQRLLADECHKSNEALQSETGVKSIINIRVFHRVLIRHTAAVRQMSASRSTGSALQALTWDPTVPSCVWRRNCDYRNSEDLLYAVYLAFNLI